MNPYEVLNVPEDADKKTIRKAYQKAAREAHPDKGGDNDDMVEINAAYRLLSDPEKRKRYDETGDDGIGRAEMTFEQHVRNVLLQMFAQAVQKPGNLLERAREGFEEAVDSLEGQRRQLEDAIEQLRGRRTKIKVKKKDAENVAHMIIDNQIAKAEQNIASIDRDREILEAARERLSDYSCSEDHAPNPMAGMRVFTSHL